LTALRHRVKPFHKDPGVWNTIQYNTILFKIKHGKNLQYDKLNKYKITNGKYDKLNKYKNAMNWFTRLPCGSQVNY
jgi:hypothetical protein